MYSNDYNQIKNGLVNYTGSLLKACPFDGELASRQFVAATLIEEALNLIKNAGDDVTYELYVAKPLLRANVIVLENRKNKLKELPQTTSVKETIKSYEDNIEFLNNIISSVKA